MILKEVLIDTAVILPWDTTDDIKSEGCFGLKDVLCAANGMTALMEVFRPQDPPAYIVIGDIGEDLTSDEEAWLKNAKHTQTVDEESLVWYVKDLFRQGYIGDGFYIVQLDPDSPL